MKKILFSLGFYFIICISSATTPSWNSKPNVGSANRSYAVGFSIGSKGYIGTGQTGSTLRKDFWEFDPSGNSGSGTWTQKADFGGVARYGAVGFSINTKGYICLGGKSSGYCLDIWEYTGGATNSWVARTNFTGTARASAFGFSLNGSGYIGCGENASGGFDDFWEFNPSGNSGNGSWTQRPNIGAGTRVWGVGFSIGTKGYAGTGRIDFLNANQIIYKDFWEYDPTGNSGNGTWTQRADFGGISRMLPVGFSIGSKGYIGTGYNYLVNPTVLGDFWSYDQATDAWCKAENFGGTPRLAAAAFSISNLGYVGTGTDFSSEYKDFWEYTPQVSFYSNIYIEGYYIGSGLMNSLLYVNGLTTNPLEADYITISAMQPSNPYGLVDQQLGTLMTNGDVCVSFSQDVVASNSYYIKVNQWNTVETWSANPITHTLTTNYSFSSAVTQSYPPGVGNEATTFDNQYAALYSGDVNYIVSSGIVVNQQDGTIDGTDYLILDYDIQNVGGGYFPTDLTGDGAIDAGDWLIMDPNIQFGVGLARP